MTKSKLSQGELVQNALVQSPAPLIDVGVNLVDHAFEKVKSDHMDNPSSAQQFTQQHTCPVLSVQGHQVVPSTSLCLYQQQHCLQAPT